MSSKSKLSIAFTTYNSAKNLKKQFNRIFNECDNSKFKNFLEIILSDNCSTDDTIKIINFYKKKSQKKKNLVIKYFKNKKNLGFRKNFIRLTQLVDSEYTLFLNDDDCPEIGYYKEIYKKLNKYNSKKMLITPIKNSNKHYRAFFGLNKVSYIINRGSILSGIILYTSMLKKFKSYSKGLYPQIELYLGYFLKHGAEDLHVKSVIKNIDAITGSKHKFNDRMQRGKDLAFFGKIQILEKFYKNKKINFIEFCYAIYSIYNWALAIKLKLNKENAQEYGSMFFNEIIKYKRKNLLRFIFFLIFLRKFFSKDRIFYYNAFIKTLNN